MPHHSVPIFLHSVPVVLCDWLSSRIGRSIVLPCLSCLLVASPSSPFLLSLSSCRPLLCTLFISLPLLHHVQYFDLSCPSFWTYETLLCLLACLALPFPFCQCPTLSLPTCRDHLLNPPCLTSRCLLTHEHRQGLLAAQTLQLCVCMKEGKCFVFSFAQVGFHLRRCGTSQDSSGSLWSRWLSMINIKQKRMDSTQKTLPPLSLTYTLLNCHFIIHISYIWLLVKKVLFFWNWKLMFIGLLTSFTVILTPLMLMIPRPYTPD